jgi:hypothetical protein
MSANESQQDRLTETARRGQEAFELHVRPKLSPADDGKFVALDIETGDYEIGTDSYTVSKAMRDRYPAERLWLVRVGHQAAFKLPSMKIRG